MASRRRVFSTALRDRWTREALLHTAHGREGVPSLAAAIDSRCRPSGLGVAPFLRGIELGLDPGHHLHDGASDLLGREADLGQYLSPRPMV